MAHKAPMWCLLSLFYGLYISSDLGKVCFTTTFRSFYFENCANLGNLAGCHMCSPPLSLLWDGTRGYTVGIFGFILGIPCFNARSQWKQQLNLM